MIRVLPLKPLALAAALVAAGCTTVVTPPAPPAAGAAPARPAVPPAATALATNPATAGTPAATVAAAAAGAASAPRPATPPAAAPPVPGQPQPFAAVIKDAKQSDGLITTWQKDDKVWIELEPKDFGKPMLFGPKIAQGIGEGWLLGGMMVMRYGPVGRQQIVEFRRVHNQVQLLALNTEYAAAAGTPEARGVQSGFSPSLIGSSAVASQPHPDRKSVLVEANPMFIADLLALGSSLQRSYRQNYALDRGNSAITAVRSKNSETVFSVNLHFATPSLAFPQPSPTPVPPGLQPTYPRSVPDARSLFLGLHYAFAALPEQPMQPRAADPRIGNFTNNLADYTSDLPRSPTQRHVIRWRLEKKDPAAELSEPVKPIVFWLDRNIPLKYRDAIARGVTGWNPAFEKIGFKNAVQVKQQPDDAEWDTLDVGAASIRWMINAQPSFGAIGPSQVDLRTGEILDADIGFESLSSRGVRAMRSQVLAAPPGEWRALMQLPAQPTDRADFADRLDGPALAQSLGLPAHAFCDHADQAAEQMSYALDVLEARGDVDPDSPEAEQFVLDYLTDTTLHEVGHTLGLRHNFRSSRVYTNAQMADAAFVRANGLAGSVMEYAPVNLAAPGAPPVPGFQVNLGPYDYWAIEYAYKPMPPGTTPAQEAAELQRIAARSAEPLLAYGTDEDNSLGIDPESLFFDLGNDPVAYARQRVEIARELIQRQATRELRPDTDYSRLRRSVSFALREMGRSSGLLARQIGGLRTLRDRSGSGRDPLQPVEAPVQRAALDALSRHFFAADSVSLPPALQRRLAPDYSERSDALSDGAGNVATDFSPASALLEMQRALLTQLMSDPVAQRVLDNEGKLDAGTAGFRLSELYERLGRDVWSELEGKSGGDIPAPRRELQREHAARIAAALLRPAGQGRADARSLLRVQAVELATKIEAAQRRPALSAEARAHLADVGEQLRQALAARISRPV